MLRPFLILAIAFLISNEAMAKFRVCYYGGYTFSGNEYSDKYDLKQINNLSSCRDPLLQSSTAVINRDYLSNNKQIKKLAESILKDSKCKSSKDIIQKYLDKSSQIETQIINNSNDRYDTLKIIELQKDYDIQSHFVLGALYNAACSNEDHRTFSMFNLETINQLLSKKAEAPEAQVTSSNKNIEDCSNVTASGSDDLEDFTVSMKNGTQNFLFAFDPFGIPDQVIVTNQNKKILYDSGCKGNMGKSSAPINLTLDAPQNSKLSIKVINNCSDRSQRGKSAWNLLLKCQSKGISPCEKELNELAELLKKEVELLKKILDHYELERQCYIAYGEKIWEYLIDSGYVQEDNRPGSQSICPILDFDCEKRIRDQRQFDLNNLQGQKLEAHQLDPPLKVLECTKKPGKDASLFEIISWSYCNVGIKKLGL